MQFLLKPVRSKFAYILAAVMMALFIFDTFPLRFFQGDSWIFESHDPALHVAGWWMYVQDNAWHWPLTMSYRQNDFGGVNVALTDGIPIVAIFFKLINSWLPAHFHYFGYWYALTFVLQAFSATWLLRTLGAKSLYAVFIGLCFAVTWPAFTQRMSHPALMTHALLISGLALYFTGIKNTWPEKKVQLTFLTLIGLSVAIHPYFMPMMLGLYVGYLIDRFLFKKSWAYFILGLLSALSIIGFMLWALGLITKSAAIGGYGGHFLSIASIFCGGGRLYHCKINGLLDVVVWEATNYFGLGLLFLLIFAVFFNFKNILIFIKNHVGLILIFIGLTLFALTNQIHLKENVIFSYPLPEQMYFIVNSFRYTGRFFWAVGYFILFSTLAYYLKKTKIWIVFFIFIMTFIQLKDVGSWTSLWKKLAHKPSELNLAKWKPIMPHVDKIMTYPAYGCDGSLIYWTVLQQTAGYYGKALNSGPAARFDKRCEDYAKVLDEAPKSRHLYTMEGPIFGTYPFDAKQKPPLAYQQMIAKNECVTADDALALLCLPGSTPDFWKQLPINTYPISTEVNTRVWDAKKLSMATSTRMLNGELNLISVDSAGKFVPSWIVLSPFMALPPGRYHYTLAYRSDDAKDKVIAHFQNALLSTDSDFAENKQVIAVDLGKGDVYGTAGAVGQLSGTFEVTDKQTQLPWILKLHYDAGDIKVRSLTLRKE